MKSIPGAYLKQFYFYYTSYAKKGVLFFYDYFLRPKSENEDTRRREFILNILLIGTIVLLVSLTVDILYKISTRDFYRGIPLKIFVWLPIFYIILLILSRKGFVRASSLLLLIPFLIGSIYSIYVWGADLPQALLSFSLIIIMAGILLNTRAAFFLSVLIVTSLLLISYLQINHIITPKTYWKNDLFNFGDSITTTLTLIVVTIVSWLSNREMEKSLARALASEIALQEERDLLEIKVEERTKEIKAMEAEKSMQLHRFAEFGKMASGLFHDLANPLTAAMLHMENLKKKYGQAASINSIDLNKVFKNIEQVKTFTEAARKQIQDQENIEDFSLPEEINLAIKTMSFKAKRAQVKIIFSPQYTFKICGNSVKFYRIICDLLSNAIDAYSGISKEPNTKREILITLSSDNNQVFIDIQDWGCGIKKDYQEKIFQPLFSTKKSSEGTGLGLYISKNIIEKDFGGNIIVQSQEGQGSNFTIKIPIKNYHGGAKCV